MKTEPDSHVYPKTFDAKGGMTKRELFAMSAMQGLMSAENESNAGFVSTRALCDYAVTVADSLIEALNKEGKP